MLEIERAFGSNICRCTGYRPILEAFKTYASDAPMPRTLQDIEDLDICKKSGKNCQSHECTESEWCFVQTKDVEMPPSIEIKLKDGKFWFRVQFIQDIFEVLQKYGYDSYMLVAGNTGKGKTKFIRQLFLVTTLLFGRCNLLRNGSKPAWLA